MADQNCPINKVDSDVTGLAISEEKCLKVAADNPVWHGVEPNSYSDFGPSFTSTARSPISRTRQNKKGNISGIEVPAGWNSDITANSHANIMQGFFYADIEQQKTNIPVSGIALANVVSSDNGGAIVFSASVKDIYAVGDIVVWRNAPAGATPNFTFVSAISDDGKTVTVSAPGTFAGTATTELAVCGFDCGNDFKFIPTANGPMKLNVTANGFDFTKKSVSVGMWLCFANVLNTAVGFGRVSSIDAANVTLDDWNFTADSFNGTGLRVFTPDVVRNAVNPDDIVTRSYRIERRLGSVGQYDQAEYIIGAVPNTAAINIPENGKVSTDLVFVGCGAEYRTGQDANNRPLTDTQTYVPVSADESAFATSTDIVLTRLTTKGDYTSGQPGASKLFGFVSESTININNNVTANNAIGVFGPFDITAGKFTVSGSVTAYFQTVAALVAAKENKTCQFTVIGANADGGFCIDIPALTAPAARLNVASGTPIMLPISPTAFENSAGYTASFQRYRYLPAIPDTTL